MLDDSWSQAQAIASTKKAPVQLEARVTLLAKTPPHCMLVDSVRLFRQ